MVAGLWLLQFRSVWYNLPLLCLGFSVFYFLAAWVTPGTSLQEGSKVLGGVAAPDCSSVPCILPCRPAGCKGEC